MLCRILVCATCKRQYNADERPIGSKVHCHCGEVIEVKAIKAHDASVVRCSSCGGAREKQADQCGFCQSDFTIHEKDLNTICPECLSRISRRAKFCHHCATPIVPETIGESELTNLPCPACKENEFLLSRQLGQEQLSVAECNRCGGLWIGFEVFARLRDRMLKSSQDLVENDVISEARMVLRNDKGFRYRKCVVCSEIMSRRHYARGSGVIIDTCKKHGIWFDQGELHQTLRWIVAGGRTSKPLKGDRSPVVRQPPTHSSPIKPATPTAQTPPPQIEAPPRVLPLTPAPQPPNQSKPPVAGRSDPLTTLARVIASCFDDFF